LHKWTDLFVSWWDIGKGSHKTTKAWNKIQTGGNSAICKEAPPKRQFSTLHRRRLKAPVLRREIKFTYSLMGLQNSAVTTCADQVPGVVNSLQSGDIYVMRECRYLVDGINGLISVEELDPV
jgi:hypothetical protein